MSRTKRFTFKVSSLDKGQRLDQFLTTRLVEVSPKELSKAKVRKLIMAGVVYLNRRRVKIASKELFENAQVEVHIDFDKLFNDRASLQKEYEVSSEDILYEDKYLIAVNKPAGIPTQPTLDQGRDHLYAAVQRFLKARNPGEPVYVGLHHRLDFDTSGIVLFTRAKEANFGVAKLFSERQAQKTYHALTVSPLQPPRSDHWVIQNHLGRSSQTGPGRRRFTAVRSGGDYAETEFRILEKFAHGYWVEAKPKTGRTHQIRVHLSEFDLPILGDPTYGKKDREKIHSPGLMLHAYSLEFPHPITEAPIYIKSPHPEAFKKVLETLKHPKTNF